MTPKLVFLRVKMPKFSKALAEHAFFFKKVIKNVKKMSENVPFKRWWGGNWRARRGRSIDTIEHLWRYCIAELWCENYFYLMKKCCFCFFECFFFFKLQWGYLDGRTAVKTRVVPISGAGRSRSQMHSVQRHAGRKIGQYSRGGPWRARSGSSASVMVLRTLTLGLYKKIWARKRW